MVTEPEILQRFSELADSWERVADNMLKIASEGRKHHHNKHKFRKAADYARAIRSCVAGLRGELRRMERPVLVGVDELEN